MEVIDHADRVPVEAWLREDLSKRLGKPIAILRTRMHAEWFRDEPFSFWPCCRGAGGFATMVRLA